MSAQDRDDNSLANKAFQAIGQAVTPEVNKVTKMRKLQKLIFLIVLKPTI